MQKINELWDKLPNFMRNNKTVRAEIKNDSAEFEDKTFDPEWVEKPINEANMITSEVNDDWGNFHRPVLDIDFAAQLVESSTPGHYHLFLDRMVGHDAYMNFLKAAAEAGIIQHGFLKGAEKRGATSVRLPWIKKGDKAANAMDPDADTKRIKAAIEFHEAIIKQLKNELLGENPCSEVTGVGPPPGWSEEELDKDVEW